MTFSMLGRCPRTGQIGACVSTSNIAVGTRVPFVAAEIGGVLTQHRTDPRLGPRGLSLMRAGCDAETAMRMLVASAPDHDWRQLAVIDAEGRTASYSGAHVKPARNEVHGKDCVAIGNILANDGVPAAMAATFERDPDQALAERLMQALEAGLAAGGEHGPVRSAALHVVHEQTFPLVDLRIDAADQPIAALRALWQEYIPWVDEFVIRAVDPDRAKGGA